MYKTLKGMYREIGIDCDYCGRTMKDEDIVIGIGDTTLCPDCLKLENNHPTKELFTPN